MKYRNPSNILDLHMAFKLLEPISPMYPKFKDWYWDNVVPGIILGNDKIIIAENKYEIVGVAVIKNSEQEKKLRALRVSEKYQKTGAGLHLIDKSLKELNHDKPVVSVSEEMINEFSRIFINRYNFDMTHVYKGLYRKDKLEYEFNGTENLKKKTIMF